MNAVCHRCGAAKAGPLLPCPGCSVTPKGRERAVAWLFSNAHLNPEELQLARERILSGEQPDPAPALMALAESRTESEGDDQPLRDKERLGLIVINAVLTPLAGLAVWWGLQGQRPTASRQALRITAPFVLALTVLWMGLIATRLFS